MIKFAIIVCVILVLKCNGAPMMCDDEIEKLAEICKGQEKASEKDMENWKNNFKPKSRMVKCLDACIGERLGMMINNTLNIDAMAKVIEVQNANEKVKYNFTTILNNCRSITDKDRCEASEKIHDCINEAWHEGNILNFFGLHLLKYNTK